MSPKQRLVNLKAVLPKKPMTDREWHEAMLVAIGVTAPKEEE